MVKFVQCVKQKPNLSVTEFRNFWTEYTTMLNALAADLGASRLALSTALIVDENLRIMQSRGTSEPYDGMVEIWIRNTPETLDKMKHPGIQDRLRELQRFQMEFMDLEKSSFFFAFEDKVFEWPVEK